MWVGFVKVTNQATGVWRVAIFVDFDNLKLRDGRFLEPGDIVQAIRNDLGASVVVQLGNLYLGMGLPEDSAPMDRRSLRQIYTQGISPVPTPSFKGSGTERVKNIADSSALVDIIASIFSYPEINAYCIATGDKDFLPGIRELRKRGKAVRIYYRRECADVLANEVNWLKGDGFSQMVDIETLPFFRERES